MRTAQHLYETVIKHLRQQKVKSAVITSTKPDGSCEYTCKYRDYTGCKCAVGCLIPDIEYSQKMEGKDVVDLINSDLLNTLRAAEFYKHAKLLLALQAVHDQKPIVEWEKWFRMIGDDLKLKYPKP